MCTRPLAKPVPLQNLREIRLQRTNLTNEKVANPTEEIIRELNNKFNGLGIGRVDERTQCASCQLQRLEARGRHKGNL
jgi:hypothetical protein